MKKIYLFSEKINSSFFKDLEFLVDHLEIVAYAALSPADALKKGYDYIQLDEGDFELFKPVLPAIDWKTNQIGVADTLKKMPRGYQPMNLNADCVLQVLKNRHFALNTAQSAMVIGSYGFVLSLISKLALVGYSHLIVSLHEEHRSAELEKKIKEFIFDLKLNLVPLADLTRVQLTSGLLVSNLSPNMDADAFQALSYFNFLYRGAVFVDFQSYENNELIEEAKRAELNVVEELEILTLKYKSLI